LATVFCVAPALGARESSAPLGQYEFAHGTSYFDGGFVLHEHAITMVGITTTLIACVRPPSKAVQYPGPPFNWQPQTTIPLKRDGAVLVFDYSGAFRDRVNGFPETMTLRGSITPNGTVSGKVEMEADDTTASTGEIRCQTRGFASFTGKYTPGG
jgi:hypothetical protein